MRHLTLVPTEASISALSFNNTAVLATALVDVATHLRGGINRQVAAQMASIATEKNNALYQSKYMDEERRLYLEKEHIKFLKRNRIINGYASLEEMTVFLEEHDGLLSRFARFLGFYTELSEEELLLLEENIAKRKAVSLSKLQKELELEFKKEEAITRIADLFEYEPAARPTPPLPSARPPRLKTVKYISLSKASPSSSLFTSASAKPLPIHSNDVMRHLQAAGPHGFEFQVNNYTLNDQKTPAIVAFSDGRFFVTWASFMDSSNIGSIYGQLFYPNGTKQGTEFLINTYDSYQQLRPSVASFSNNGFVVVWESFAQDGDGFGIYGQLFYSNGMKQGSEFQVNTFTTNAQYFPKVTTLLDDNFVVCWDSYAQDGSEHGIFGQRFNMDGTKISSEFLVNTYTSSNQDYASIARIADGFGIAWASLSQAISNQYRIYAQLFYANGNKRGAEISVSGTNSGNPLIKGFATGNFIIVWEALDDSGLGLYGQLFYSNGTKISNQFQVNTYTSGFQYTAALAIFPDNEFIVSWSSDAQDGSSFGIFAQHFYSNGTKKGAEFLINTYTAGEQYRPAMAILPNNDFITVWESAAQDGSAIGIYGQRFTMDGIKIAPGGLLATASPTVTSTSSASLTSTPYYSATLVPTVSPTALLTNTPTASASLMNYSSFTNTPTPVSTASANPTTRTSNSSLSEEEIKKIIIGVVTSSASAAAIACFTYFRRRCCLFKQVRDRMEHGLANALRNHFKINIDDYESEKGRKYIAVVNGIVEELRTKHGLSLLKSPGPDQDQVAALMELLPEQIEKLDILEKQCNGKYKITDFTKFHNSIELIANGVAKKYLIPNPLLAETGRAKPVVSV
jgi:hypothetical protein